MKNFLIIFILIGSVLGITNWYYTKQLETKNQKLEIQVNKMKGKIGALSGEVKWWKMRAVAMAMFINCAVVKLKKEHNEVFDRVCDKYFNDMMQAWKDTLKNIPAEKAGQLMRLLRKYNRERYF